VENEGEKLFERTSLGKKKSKKEVAIKIYFGFKKLQKGMI